MEKCVSQRKAATIQESSWVCSGHWTEGGRIRDDAFAASQWAKERESEMKRARERQQKQQEIFKGKQKMFVYRLGHFRAKAWDGGGEDGVGR